MLLIIVVVLIPLVIVEALRSSLVVIVIHLLHISLLRLRLLMILILINFSAELRTLELSSSSHVTHWADFVGRIEVSLCWCCVSRWHLMLRDDMGAWLLLQWKSLHALALVRRIERWGVPSSLLIVFASSLLLLGASLLLLSVSLLPSFPLLIELSLMGFLCCRLHCHWYSMHAFWDSRWLVPWSRKHLLLGQLNCLHVLFASKLWILFRSVVSDDVSWMDSFNENVLSIRSDQHLWLHNLSLC